MNNKTDSIPVKNIDIPLNNGDFVKSLLNQLSGSLQEIIGLEEAEAFISIVGEKKQKIFSLFQMFKETL